jgi:hypothetical protein
MAQVHLRNLEDGTIKVVESASEEFAKLKAERTENGRFPLYEQTGAHDADPEGFASEEEVAARERWNVKPLSDVTADGVGISQKAKDKVGENAAADLKEAHEGKPAKAAAKAE